MRDTRARIARIVLGDRAIGRRGEIDVSAVPRPRDRPQVDLAVVEEPRGDRRGV
jgi:hypothetical protein